MKAHRVLIARMSGYAEEAASYLRRRRMTRKPFARVYHSGGRGRAIDPGSEEGQALFRAAASLIDAAR